MLVEVAEDVVDNGANKVVELPLMAIFIQELLSPQVDEALCKQHAGTFHQRHQASAKKKKMATVGKNPRRTQQSTDTQTHAHTNARARKHMQTHAHAHAHAKNARSKPGTLLGCA